MVLHKIPVLVNQWFSIVCSSIGLKRKERNLEGKITLVICSGWWRALYASNMRGFVSPNIHSPSIVLFLLFSQALYLSIPPSRVQKSSICPFIRYLIECPLCTKHSGCNTLGATMSKYSLTLEVYKRMLGKRTIILFDNSEGFIRSDI